MKRFAYLAVLMALSSPACARDSYSFTVHGHRIHVEADRHCRSLSCVSISIPGVGNWRNGRDRDDDDVATVREPKPAPAPAAAQPAAVPPQAQAAPAPAAPPVARIVTVPPALQAQPVPQPVLVQAVPPAVAPALVAPPTLAAAPPENKPIETTSSTTPVPAVSAAAPRLQQSPTPPAPAAQPQAAEPVPAATKPQQPTVVAKPAEKPSAKPFAEMPAIAAQPAAPVAHEAQEIATPAADSPLGDWQTEGKNTILVHIEACGHALCGYVLDASTKAKGESILVNMKPKGDTQWSGNVYSRTSGNSYYGTMTLKQADTLRVKACALGQFLCSANNWTRVQPKADQVVTSERARLDRRS